MSNYFDNQDKWSWQITDNEALVITDHGDHTHTIKVTNVPIGEMINHTGQVMGDAHRAASHDFKEDTEMKNIGNNVTEEIETETTVQEDGIDDGMDL